jgi:AcrR family transcriptional regulator
MAAMATRPKRRLPAAERRELIMNSAGRLFGERGYSHATLDEIAAAADVTKPVLYRHFDSKKGLYMALLERHRDDLPKFIERVPPDLPMDRRIEAILETWFAYVEEYGYAWKMLFRDSGGGPEIAALRQASQDRAREVLAAFIRAQQDTGIPEREVMPLAEFIRAAGAGLALWSLEHPEVPRADLVAAVRRVVVGLLGATQG